MSKDHLTNSLYRVISGGECPICGRWFKPNGTGPEGNKLVHWALKLMPWDEILNEKAVPVHDWRCHIGECEDNLTFEETTQEFRENVRNSIHTWCTKPWRIWRRWFYRPCFTHLDEVYAYAVGKTSAGREAYDHNGCILK